MNTINSKHTPKPGSLVVLVVSRLAQYSDALSPYNKKGELSDNPSDCWFRSDAVRMWDTYFKAHHIITLELAQQHGLVEALWRNNSKQIRQVAESIFSYAINTHGWQQFFQDMHWFVIVEELKGACKHGELRYSEPILANWLTEDAPTLTSSEIKVITNNTKWLMQETMQ